VFVVGKTTVLDVPADRLYVEQVSILAGAKYVISFQETDLPLFKSVETRLLDAQRVIRRRGPGYLVYSLLDTLVDELLASLDTIEEWIVEMEDEVLVHKRHLELDEIFRLKRVVLVLSRIASPMQELAKRLQALDSEIVPDVLDVYFRDLAEHATRAVERITNARFVLQNLQEYFHMEGDHRNNDVMRVLTVVATIFIPLSFVAGVYGMNFNPEASPWNMPELETYYGYPITLCAMCVYAIVLMVYFKRKKWL
jgi:magnesium transporter